MSATGDASNDGRALAARRARRRALLTRAEALVSDGTAPQATGLPVVLLPANRRALVPLDAATRDAFRARLQATLHEAMRYDAGSSAPRADVSDPHGAPTDAARTRHAACCAVCQGACCLAGGTRAHLDAATLVRVRHDRAQAGLPSDEAALEAHYVAHLPVVHVAGSCAFHGEAGCTLPRTLRSDLCNRYLCGALAQLDRALAATGRDAAFVVATDDVALHRAAIVSARGPLPVPLATGHE